MKININKYLKLVVTIVIVIMMCITSFLLYKVVSNNKYKEEKISLYSCNNKANINYKVFLKPNILYDDDSLKEGEMYIKEFVDYIETTFKYEFNGDEEADIEGNYEIVAKVEGVAGEGETQKTIWDKDFKLLSKQNFHVKDKTISIKKDMPLKLEQYTDFANNVIKDSKISASVKLSILMNVNVKAETSHGPIEEKLCPTMIIPLNTNYFGITGNLTEEKPGSIEDTKQVELPLDKKKVKFYGFAIGVLLIILISIIFFTKGTAIADPLEKELKKIFKNHGDRMVALNNEAVFTFKNHNEVKSIEDLVKIADEIGKPIMYKYSSNFNKISKFYVFDEAQMYILDLSKVAMKSNTKDSNKEKKKSKDNVADEIIVTSESMHTLSQKEENETTDIK